MKIRILCGALITFVSAAHASGTAVFVKGVVKVYDGNGASTLQRGDILDVGMRLESAQGFAQIRLTDGSLVSIKPGQTLAIGPKREAPDGEEEADSVVKKVLRLASGSGARANRTTLVEELTDGRETNEISLLNSLNLLTPDGGDDDPGEEFFDEDVNEPDGGQMNPGGLGPFYVRLAGATAGNDTANIRAAQSIRDGVLENSAITTAMANFGISRDDGSSIRTDVASPDQISESFTDTNTGITWGYWADTQASDSATGQTINLADSPLHAVISAGIATEGRDVSELFATPLTGSVSFSLVSASRPTDTLGNIGELGQANLQVNFDQGTVDTQLELMIDNTLWSATGQTNLHLNNLFSGDFSQVDAGGVAGTGAFSGFIQNSADYDGAVADGAGLAYQLEAQNIGVVGAAILGRVE